MSKEKIIANIKSKIAYLDSLKREVKNDSALIAQVENTRDFVTHYLELSILNNLHQSEIYLAIDREFMRCITFIDRYKHQGGKYGITK